MQAKVCTHAFQFTTFSVKEFQQGSKRMQPYSQNLANKLNSGEKFNTNTNFETELTLIRTPSASSGRGKERSIGRRNVEAFFKAKRKKEDGLYTSGVFHDALSAFWNSFNDLCTNGKDERVPVIRHDLQVAEWEAIARITVKGKAFTTAFLFAEEAVKEYLLLESFLAYLSSDERELLDKAQENEWLDFLERFNWETVPKTKQVKDVVLEIAHKEFIQTPRYIVDSWSTLFSEFHREFSSTDCLLEMFARDIQLHHMLHFNMQAKVFTHAFQSTTFSVKEFQQGSQRMQTYSQSLANKLNSREKFNTNNFETELTLIRTPSASSGRGKERSVGRRNVEAFLKAKRSVST
ncbi:hypothetical protein pdam_00009813 [Pocillopora damicornis]|uniref:Uncharacterized protein n=1 Tax=Pocillopora damicornis TaxID=46731 RepID=A0A3M6UZW1_POCDA|nr:hypothetical protein pdam_00009813 [Pocillopora damicornis]